MTTTAQKDRLRRADEDRRDGETAADRQHARAVERNEELLSATPRLEQIARHSHYRSKSNGGVYPAMRSPAGYEDQNPTEWSPADDGEVKAAQAELDDPDSGRDSAQYQAAAYQRAQALRGAGIGLAGVLDDGRIYGQRPEDYIRANSGYGTNTQQAGLPTDPREVIASAGLPGLLGAQAIPTAQKPFTGPPEVELKPADIAADEIRAQDVLDRSDDAHIANVVPAVGVDETVRSMTSGVDVQSEAVYSANVSKEQKASKANTKT